MSEAEAPKPVEALQPEAEAAPTTQPTEEKSEETTQTSEDKSEEKKEILKTTAKHDENPRNNRKFDPSVREVTDDPEAIRKQVCIAFPRPFPGARTDSTRSSSTLVTGTSPKTSSCGSHAAEPRTSP